MVPWDESSIYVDRKIKPISKVFAELANLRDSQVLGDLLHIGKCAFRSTPYKRGKVRPSANMRRRRGITRTKNVIQITQRAKRNAPGAEEH